MSATAGWTDPRFARIAALVEARAGLAPPSCPGAAEDGMRRSMQRSGAQGLSAYLALLEGSDPAMDDLLTELTIGETYFFRTVEHFDYVRDEVLPALEAQRPGGWVRGWSAGCSSGEEPYSLAAVMLERGLGERMSVLGTDVSRGALARARAGDYGEWSLRGEGAGRMARYLTPHGKRFQLSETLRGRVELGYLNLALDQYPSLSRGLTGIDIVFCRNVLIYFQPQVVEAVAQRLCATLSDAGVLITGPSDPPLAALADFEPQLTSFGLVYRKRAPHRPRSRVPAPPPSPPPALRVPPAARPPAPPPPQVAEKVARAPSPAPPRPGDPPLEQARGAMREGRWMEALAQLSGQTAPPAQELAIQAQANLDLSRARVLCLEAIQRHPLHAPFRHLNALLLLGLGRIEEAEAAATEAIYLDPTLAVARLAQGQILRRRGELRLAAQAYRTAETLCRGLPEDAELPLAEGETAGRLAQVAANERALLEAQEEPRG